MAESISRSKQTSPCFTDSGEHKPGKSHLFQYIDNLVKNGNT